VGVDDSAIARHDRFSKILLQHFAHAIHDSPLRQVLGCARIDDLTADVSGDPGSIHLDFLIRQHGDFGNLSKIRAMARTSDD
jgi:hypothetical protein